MTFSDDDQRHICRAAIDAIKIADTVDAASRPMMAVAHIIAAVIILRETRGCEVAAETMYQFADDEAVRDGMGRDELCRRAAANSTK